MVGELCSVIRRGVPSEITQRIEQQKYCKCGLSTNQGLKARRIYTWILRSYGVDAAHSQFDHSDSDANPESQLSAMCVIGSDVCEGQGSKW
jgi:hypothetical protein